MFLKVIELGEGFMDPDTGEMLGQDETYIGAIKITEVKSKFSIGKILEGDIERGAIASKMSKSEGKKANTKYKAAEKKRKAAERKEAKKRRAAEKKRLKKCKKEKNC